MAGVRIPRFWGAAEGVEGYHDITRYPDSRRIPGLVLFRWDAPLFFANAELFHERVLDAVATSPTPVRWLVVAAAPITSVDVTAADMLAELDETLHGAGVGNVLCRDEGSRQGQSSNDSDCSHGLAKRSSFRPSRPSLAAISRPIQWIGSIRKTGVVERRGNPRTSASIGLDVRRRGTRASSRTRNARAPAFDSLASGANTMDALSSGPAVVLVLLTALYAMPVFAVDLPPEPQGGTTQVTSGEPPGVSAPPADDDNSNIPNSTEEGQVDLSQSFEHRPLLALLRESRLVGLRDTTISVDLRSFYLNRENFNTSESEAWTVGGSAGFRTGYFGDLVALGATNFTSQRLSGPPDKDGTKLLQTGQRSYDVLGEIYASFRLTDKITGVAGRRAFDTPFINTQDSLMTPNTFQAYAVQGEIGDTDTRTLRFGAGYVDRIKERDSDVFIPMSEAAGAPAGVDRGVYVAGAVFKTSQLAVGAIDYYSQDVINIAYSEIKYAIPLANRLRLRFAGQYTDQRSIGTNLLTGKPFATDQYGLKAELAIGTGLLTVGRTINAKGTSSGSGSGTHIRSPWGSYPGYTKVQVEYFNRAGEVATLLRAAYDFQKITGLSLYALWVHGSRPDDAKQYARQEYDFNVEWTAQSGTLKGLDLRARYAHIAQAGPSDQHEDELRLILNYPLR